MFVTAHVILREAKDLQIGSCSDLEMLRFAQHDDCSEKPQCRGSARV
jgi:hypothetical protein